MDKNKEIVDMDTSMTLQKPQTNRLKEIFHLHVYKLDASTISSWKHRHDLKAATIAIPSWTIFEDFCNLKIQKKCY